eukprot:606694-Amphidinium_carterae.1
MVRNQYSRASKASSVPLRMTRLSSNSSRATPHEAFTEIAGAVSRAEFSSMKMMLETQRSQMAVTRNSSGFYVPTTLGEFIGAWFPLHPMSPNRLIFDSFSLVVLMVDSILVPYLIAWEIELEGWKHTKLQALTRFSSVCRSKHLEIDAKMRFQLHKHVAVGSANVWSSILLILTGWPLFFAWVILELRYAAEPLHWVHSGHRTHHEVETDSSKIPSGGFPFGWQRAHH